MLLKSLGRASFLVRILSLVCVCMRRRTMPSELRERIRPLPLGPYDCWCDRARTGGG